MSALHTVTRSQSDIVARARAADDMFGWSEEVLLPYLDFDHVRPFLKDGVTAEEWAESTEDPAKVRDAAHSYYVFALGKIEDERGISAERSVIKLREFAWLMGLDDVIAAMDEAGYSPYGAPKVAAFAAGLGFTQDGDPVTAPLVVNTTDGTCWTRREAVRDGSPLYAPEKCGQCPEFVMATYAELEGHGIAGQLDALPVPVGPDAEAAHEARRDRYAKALYEFVNGAFAWEACDDQDSWRCEADAAIAVADDELTGVNLALYEEELGNARLRLALKSAQRGRRELRSRVAELEAQRERRRLRLIALQNDALSMRGSLSPAGEDRKVPFPLGETLTPAVDWLIARVAELEAAQGTVFRASHDSIGMGLYTTREAAQAHCEAKVQQEEPAGSIRHMSWVADDIGEDAEYELHITPAGTGKLIRGTGYVVTPVEVASEYDEEADE